MGISSLIKIDITKKFILILFDQLYILLFGYISLHLVILVSKNSCIMLVNILLFQHYSCQIRNLLFLILCQHNRLRPTPPWMFTCMNSEPDFLANICEPISLA